MFIFMFVTLTIGQLYFEYKIAKALHLDELSRRFILLNLGMSIAISLLFGFLFPAAGMTIAAAGLISTVLSQPMYDVVNAYKRTKIAWTEGKGIFAQRKDQIVKTFKDLWTIVSTIAKILMFPFKVLGAIAHGINVVSAKIEGSKTT